MLISQWWSPLLRRYLQEREPELTRRLERGFAFIPADQRVGPWAWSPTVALAALAQAVAASWPQASETFLPVPEAEALRPLRLAGFAFGALGLAYIVRKYGAWVMSSWTMLGWTAATVRYLAGAAGFRYLQRALTFPSLFANTVTVSIWYLGILPGIVAMSPKHQRRRALENFALSFSLFLIHGVNLPFSLLDWYIQPVRLDAFDLWAGSAYSVCYLAFYLSMLDAAGVHFYFILTPRKWWAALVYVLALGYGVALRSGFNVWEARLSGAIPG